jgi:hypothetical protein
VSFRVLYADVRRMHWRTASRACQAIEAFADRGSGAVAKRKDGTYELRVSGAVVIFVAPRQAGEIHVLRILPL